MRLRSEGVCVRGNNGHAGAWPGGEPYAEMRDGRESAIPIVDVCVCVSLALHTQGMHVLLAGCFAAFYIRSISL